MNINYRNALLIAAISSLAACAGDTAQGTGESPLNDPNFDPAVLANGDDAALLAHQEIASLLGGVFQTILGTTTEVSRSTVLMTDTTSGIGKVVGGALDTPSSVSGIAIAPGAQPCTNGGNFELTAKYEYINAQGQAATPADFVTFGDFDVTTSISTIYTNCNEPARAGYDVNNLPILETDDMGNVVDRIIDGSFGLAFNSTPHSTDGGVTKGFSFTATLLLSNYSIQEGANSPRLMDADLSFTLLTDDASGDTYQSSISGDIVSQNDDGQSFTKTTLIADGSLTIDFENYNLFLDGSIIDYSMLNNPFSFYSETQLVRNAGDPQVDGVPVPSSGTLVIKQGDVTGRAVVMGNQLEVTTTDAQGTVTVEMKEWCDLLGNCPAP